MRPFHRWLLTTTSVLTGVTGVVYFWMDRMLAPPEAWSVVNHPLQPWVLKAHILVAPALVLAIGMVVTDHIWKHYRSRVVRARRTGVTTMWVLVPMIVTGYLIQSVTHPLGLAVVAWAHIGTGALFLGGLAAHRWVLRRRATARVQAPATVLPTS